ncbi:hypothetical protein M6B38_335470 [Iris pallida]|uniref:Uncharacterized protein n=1 Tax=Iris pallida TaxID=29817 RepID=A0AAX6H0G7_IRIPA|nr:hypothetical protein M6B38_335470 [Iris pallida]
MMAKEATGPAMTAGPFPATHERPTPAEDIVFFDNRVVILLFRQSFPFEST